MELKRFKDIIAIKTNTGVNVTDTIVAFHASNLEVAELSDEAFQEMSSVTLLSNETPIVTANNFDAYNALQDWNNQSNPDILHGRLDPTIKNLTININQICNLRCTYCSAGGDGTYGDPSLNISVEKTLPQLKFFLSYIKRGSTFSISFIGGEPLLYPEAIRAIYEYTSSACETKNLNPVFKIVTNGTLIAENNTIEILRSMKINLTISLDGTKKNNDAARPSKDNKSTTEKIISGLDLLKSDRGLIQSINISAITSQNNSSLFENYLYLKSLNPDSLDFIFDNESADSTLQQKFISDMNAIAAEAWKNGGEGELRKIRLFDHYFSLLDRQQRIENHCGAGKTHITIDAKNRLFACVWDVNDLKTNVGQGNTVDEEKISKYSKSLIELNNCDTCWARYLCGGGCMYINKLRSGDKHKKSSQFCERTRSLILTSLLYYKLARG